MSNRVLLTGAQGFVGRYLVAELLANDPGVTIVGVGRSQRTSTFTHDVSWRGTRRPAPLPANLLRATTDVRYEYRQVDIRDRAALLPIVQDFRPDVVLHMASGLRDDPPPHLFATNVAGTIDLLESIHEASLRPKAVVIGSSGSVYGLSAALPIDEEAPTEPRDFYAVSKLAQEHVARIVSRERDLPIVFARIFNIVGAGQDERHVAGRFATQLAAMIGDSGERCVRAGNLSSTRDYIDVRDVARALVTLGSGAAEGTYNVASGLEVSTGRVLELLTEAAGLRDRVSTQTAYVRPSDIPRVVADISRLRATGYVQSVTLEQSVQGVLDYYLQTFGSN